MFLCLMSLSVFFYFPCLSLSVPVSFTSLSPNCLVHSWILLCPVKHSKPLVTASWSILSSWIFSLSFFLLLPLSSFIPGCFSVSCFSVCVSLGLSHMANFKHFTWKCPYLNLLRTCIYPEIRSCFFYHGTDKNIYWTRHKNIKQIDKLELC